MVSTIHHHGASRGMEWDGVGREENVNRSHCTSKYSIQETCFMCLCVCVCAHAHVYVCVTCWIMMWNIQYSVSHTESWNTKCLKVTILQDSLVAQRLKRLPPMRETRVRSLGQEDPVGKEMATHSHILACRIPWTEEPGGLQSTGSQRVGHDWVTLLLYTWIQVRVKGNEIFLKIYIKRGEKEGKERKQRKEGILLSRGVKTDMIKGTFSWFIDFWNPVFTLK